MPVTPDYPVPVPTPYQSPDYGGNEYVTPGTTGPAISADDRPLYGPTYSGNVSWASGVQTTPSSVTYPTTQTSSPAPAPAPTNTGGGGGGGINLKDPNSNPGSGYFWDAADGWKQVDGGGQSGPSQQEIDAAFNPIFDVYNKAESNLRGQLPGLIGEAEDQANVSRGLLQNQRTGANELLGLQEQKTNTQQQRQSAQQRQTLQELQLANQQRFGGASSAGLGASEIQGREFQRSQFGIQENAQQALQQIGQQKQVVEREYQQGLQQLEVNRKQAVNEVNRRFQDKMLEIDARRGETQAAKAQARLSALQELRNQAFQINVAREQFANDLKLQAQSNMSYLNQSANQFTGAGQAGASAYNQYGATTPTGMSGVQGSNQQTGGAVPTGQISGTRPEDLYGSIMGSSETDPRFANYVPNQSNAR